MGTGFKFQMGMGMKSLKWEGIGTKNLFPHTSSLQQARPPFDPRPQQHGGGQQQCEQCRVYSGVGGRTLVVTWNSLVLLLLLL